MICCSNRPRCGSPEPKVLPVCNWQLPPQCEGATRGLRSTVKVPDSTLAPSYNAQQSTMSVNIVVASLCFSVPIECIA